MLRLCLTASVYRCTIHGMYTIMHHIHTPTQQCTHMVNLQSYNHLANMPNQCTQILHTVLKTLKYQRFTFNSTYTILPYKLKFVFIHDKIEKKIKTYH